MIGLLVKVPFHSQIRKTEPRFAQEIAAAVAAAARASAAKLVPTEESFFLAFDEDSSPCRLRAAEAARLLLEAFKSFNPRLHGWCLVLDTCRTGDDEDLRQFRRLWYGIHTDGLFLGPGAAHRFDPYFRKSEDPEGGSPGCLRVEEAIFARPALPADHLPPPPSGPRLETLIDELGDLGVGASPGKFLAVMGKGRTPAELLDAALAGLYPRQGPRFMRLRASAVSPSPYGPILDGLRGPNALQEARSGGALLLSGADRGLLKELDPILEFLSRAPFREGYAPALDVRLRVCTAAALRLYAREMRARSLPAFVILDGIELFLPPSLDLGRLLMEGALAEEGISVVVLGLKLPALWPLETARRIEAESGSAADIAKGGEESFRLKTRARLALCQDEGGEKPRALADGAPLVDFGFASLSTLPSEYAELLSALALAEDVLRDADLDSFLDSLGYVEGIRSLIYPRLSQLGFLEGRGRPRVAFPEAAVAAVRVLKDGGSRLKTAFAGRLLALYGQRTIIPSLALYRRIRDYGAESTATQSLRLFLDCVSADEVYGPSLPDGLKPDSPLASYVRFLEAYTAQDRSLAEQSLSELESNLFGGDPLSAGTAALARAALEYSTRSPAAAARRAKNALMSLHTLGAPRAEARAHRLLGLCALAQDQIQEGADYLSNAYEIAESIDDPLGSILAAQAESAAYFVLGDLGKSLARAAAFANRAAQAFRSDWEMAGAFMEGRIAFELGAYPAAEESFGRVRAQARVYGHPDAALRAEYWMGRAASAAGESDRAREILLRGDDDVEALWFLAELEYWEGRMAAATTYVERAVSLAARPGFSSADAFDWSSGFGSIEGRAVGFASGRSYLADQVLAFRDFCVGLASPAEAQERADRLALQTREERLSVMHPSIHTYLFYRYLIIKEQGQNPMDSATVLSKAFKALQLRAARMSDAVRKDAFMERNRWNRNLLSHARAHKLI